jgi:hypothetical protein
MKIMSSTQQRAIISFFVILVTSLIVAGAVAIKPDKETQPTTPQTTVVTDTVDETDDPADPTQAELALYNDGTYQASGSYSTPGGTESIGVSITITNDTVSATSATNEATGRDSMSYVEDFIGSYSSFVVGRKLDDIQLGVVAGSSLTPHGFNQALESIKQQAER